MESTWAFLAIRLFTLTLFLLVVYLLQRFWFVRAWRLISRAQHPRWKVLLRSLWVAAVVLLALAVIWNVVEFRVRLIPREDHWDALSALLGLWFSSSFLALLAVNCVKGIEWLWRGLAAAWNWMRSPSVAAPEPLDPPNPSRRYFFQTASYLAGAVPFVGALYGFAAERLCFQVRRVEVPIPGLPAALDGLRIAQISDIHRSAYMSREEVRRAVEMANELGGDLAVVTGDFITGLNDPLQDCIEELGRLRAPLGVWGCNGNHEIYADAEDDAEELFRRHGMRLLRRQNAQLAWRGASFNLIGVDYQRERAPSGQRLPMLRNLEPLVRHDIPNILLSHNPNAFPRAAELGIELTLSGHTHGGQVQVEILDRRWSPARFITDYVAGLYHRPLAAPSVPADPRVAGEPAFAMDRPPRAAAALYVNRGLGTVGAPVRLGVPPEITLLTLRRA